MTVTRRFFLAGLASCPLCAGLARGKEGAHWSYDDPQGWGAHDPSARACAVGDAQSPIDLAGAAKAEIEAPALSWKAQAFRIANNGHTIQAIAAPGGSARLENREFAFQQFHFHTPSEHAIDGARFAMEAHFVHGSDDGGLLVLGVFLKAGASNRAFATIMAAAPQTEGERRLGKAIDASALLPNDRRLFRYHGSLTSPPCSETVAWNVFQQPVEVAAADIASFKKLFPMNARPLQPRRERALLRN